MAPRLNPNHRAEVRERIRTSQLLNRLQSCALGEIDLSKSELKSIEILLRKTLPDLQSVTLNGDADNPVAVSQSLTVRFVAPKAD